MTSLPIDGSSRASIRQISTDRLSLSSPSPLDTSPSPSTGGSAKATATTVTSTDNPTHGGVTLPSSSRVEYISRSTFSTAYETARFHHQGANYKGTGVQRSLDWRWVTCDAPEAEREELAYQLLATLPRSRLAAIQRQIIPFLQFDLVGSLPPEISLQVLILLPASALLNCTLVCKRWNVLANDQTLWRNLCLARGWEWRPRLTTPSPRQGEGIVNASTSGATQEDRDEDEGMGDEEEEEDEGSVVDAEEVTHIPNGSVSPDNEPISTDLNLQDYDLQNLIGQFASISSPTASIPISRSSSAATTMFRTFSQRHPSSSTSQAGIIRKVDYKLLHQTQTLLRSRVRHGAYHLRTLPGVDGGGHAAAVYCLALWSYDSTLGPLQVLFTGSKDRTVREWDLTTNKVRRRVMGMHTSSVLSLCVTATTTRMPEDGNGRSGDHAGEGYKNSGAGVLVSGGSDCRVVVWDLARFKLIKALKDHQDSVLCVRINNGRLVSCSKDRTIRTYSFPYLKPELILRGHRAAVNAVSTAGDMIVSGSGDRSVRVWDARTGTLISNFEDHHARAISSVELSLPFILSGSSDRHIRMFNMRNKRGWSTCPEFDNPTVGQPVNPLALAQESLGGGEIPESGSSFFLHSSLAQSSPQTRRRSHTSRDEFRVCDVCGTWAAAMGGVRGPERHSHPVRSVAMGDEFAVSGSYDCTVKVWDKTTGALVADLASGHTGRIFCVAQDSTKIVSCGEDQRICIWDFSHGVDTSFIKL